MWAIIFGGLIVFLLFLIFCGLPVAFAFGLVNIVGLYFLCGPATVRMVAFSCYSSIAIFAFVALPMFVLIGELLFRSGIAGETFDALDKWIGRLPGRLSILAVLSGALFGALTGSSIASNAALGPLLMPEMEKRGYSKRLSMGPIMAGSGLAVLIPPSGGAVIFAIIAQIEVGDLLIANILPALLLIVLYIITITIWVTMKPGSAPTYKVEVKTLERITALRHIFPVVIIIFMVTGLIYLGVTTPSEAACLGALGAFVVALAYRRLSWSVIGDSLMETMRVSCMCFLIVAGARAYSQLLAYTGVTASLCQAGTAIDMPPTLVFTVMVLIVMFLGCLMDQVSIAMITIPIFLPVLQEMDLNILWFAVVMMVNGELASFTPPFGINLFVMKGLAPEGTKMKDIYLASLPFCIQELAVMILLIAFPPLSLWLVKTMR